MRRDRLADAAARSGGSAREALRRLDPESADVGAAIDALAGRLPGVDWRAALRLADRFAGSGGAEAHERFVLAVYDWLAARARSGAARRRSGCRRSPSCGTGCAASAREVEALNIDRKTHALALLQEIAERARRL